MAADSRTGTGAEAQQYRWLMEGLKVDQPKALKHVEKCCLDKHRNARRRDFSVAFAEHLWYNKRMETVHIPSRKYEELQNH